MSEACWKIDMNDEACYIDAEEDDYSDPNREYSRWSDLPDLLLEEIFSYLNIRQRYYASLVCVNWYRAFHLPGIWSNFLVEDDTLTRTKFNYYSGWQYVLDHMRTQNCLQTIGKYIKGLEFQPLHSFNNLFQFMTLITWYLEENRKVKGSREAQGVGQKIKRLKYLFPCNMANHDDPEGVKLFGTGGQLLAALKRLMLNLNKLETLQLIDLLLERYEAKHLLDEVLESCCMGLRILYLINVTSVHCPIMHVGLFFNLRILVISPQNVDNDVLTLIADSRIEHLHLYQNRYSPISIAITPCSPKSWRVVKRDNPELSVHLRVESTENAEVLIQPEAPVKSILYSSPKTQITSENILRIVDMYKFTLQVYGHELLPTFSSPKSFHNRIDSLLLLMARECPNLSTLIVRETISTSTVLLIAKTAINLRKFYIRQNAVMLCCDWPKNPEWSTEFFEWLQMACQSYDSTEREVSQILGYRWIMLSDELFEKVDVNVRDGI